LWTPEVDFGVVCDGGGKVIEFDEIQPTGKALSIIEDPLFRQGGIAAARIGAVPCKTLKKQFV
jgi:hypothetical protein